MPKTYPLIDTKKYTQYITMENFRKSKSKILISRVYRSTTSSSSPNFPETLTENSFMTTTTTFLSSPRLYDPFSGGEPRGYLFVSAISAPSFFGCPQEIEGACYYKALTRFYGGIPQITANLALLYRERKKTMDSISTATLGILKLMKDIRRKKVPELFMNMDQLRNRKKLSGAWLNYVYGIKPFAQDLYAIKCSELNPIIWLSGRATSPYTSYSSDKDGSFLSNNGTYSVTIKGGLSLSSPIVATLAGAGLTNPALIAWELTPFSFMIDWLLPVGPFLENLSSTSGYTKHPGSVTRGTKEDYIEGLSTGASAKGSYTLIDRNTIDFPSAPLPHFKNPFSPLHALNALSIMHQFVKNPPRR